MKEKNKNKESKASAFSKKRHDFNKDSDAEKAKNQEEQICYQCACENIVNQFYVVSKEHGARL